MNIQSLLFDMIHKEPYRTMYLESAAFNYVVNTIRRANSDEALELLLEGLYTLAEDNEKLKRELTDCIQRTPGKTIMVQDMPKQSSFWWPKRK